MKYLFVTLMLGAIISITIFGVFNMNHDKMDNHGDDCVAANFEGVDCPKNSNTLDYLNFHLNTFKKFSLAAFGENIASILLSAFVSLVLIALNALSLPFLKFPEPSLCRQRFRRNIAPYQKQTLTRWLALHENSPAGY